MDRVTAPAPPAALWTRYRAALIVITAVGAAGSLAGLVAVPERFWFAYLTAYVFGLTLVLGMLFFVMLHHVTDAGWSVVVRRPAEQCLAALPVLLVLFVPIAIAVTRGTLFHWTRVHAPLVAAKWPFLTSWFFLIRAGLYFAVWIGLARIMRGKSLAQDVSGDKSLTLQMRRWSGPGFIPYAFTFTFAAIDWVMTLKYEWFSTIFGVYVWSGSVVGALAGLTLMVLWLRRGPLEGVVSSEHLTDLGRLLFAFSVFWAYIAFSQYFLIWYANIPEETSWFLDRWHASSWRAVCVVLPILHFVVPFFGLMAAAAKRNARVLAAMGVMLVVVHYVDVYWMVMPTIDEQGIRISGMWVDLATLCFIAGAVGLTVLWTLARHPAYPVRDPRLAESLALGHHEEEEHGAAVGQH